MLTRETLPPFRKADVNTFRSSYSAPPVVSTAITKSRASAIAMAPVYQSPAPAPIGPRLVGPPPPHIVSGSADGAPLPPSPSNVSGLKKRLNTAMDADTSRLQKRSKTEDGMDVDVKQPVQGLSAGARRPPPRPVGGAAGAPPAVAIKKKPPPSLFVPSKKVRSPLLFFSLLSQLN